MEKKMSAHIPSPKAKRNRENLRRIIEVNKKRKEILEQKKKRETEKAN